MNLMTPIVAGYTRNELELLRQNSKNYFNSLCRQDWVEQLLWTQPKRAKWLLDPADSKVPRGYNIFDGTHILALRAFTAGFLEGNTSASRPWMRYSHPDPERNTQTNNRQWLDLATRRSLSFLSNSNFYQQAGQFYNDYGCVNTGAHIFKKVSGGIQVFTLYPGSYYVINNGIGEAEMLIREFAMDAMALVKRYGKKVNGDWDWDMFTTRVKSLYDHSDTTVQIQLVEIFCRNKDFSTEKPISGSNRQWVNMTYETGVQSSFDGFQQFSDPTAPDNLKYLEIGFSRRRPFIVGKSQSETPYGDTGPTSDAIGIIRSLNKKAVSKDLAIEKMLDPTLQGPANIRKGYVTTQARKFVPLDATGMAQGGLKSVYDVNPGLGALVADVQDMRNQVEKFYYADFLLYLSNNPKTRTAEEVREIVTEKQSVIGPYLQTLNWSYNMPIAEYMLDFVLTEDPYLPPPPPDLQGQWINTEFTSVFSQVQRAFDLPQINQFVSQWEQLAQMNPKAWDNFDTDVYAKVLQDRYYLPAGLVRDQDAVDALRDQAQKQQQRQQMIDSLPQIGQGAQSLAQAQQISQQIQPPQGLGPGGTQPNLLGNVPPFGATR